MKGLIHAREPSPPCSPFRPTAIWIGAGRAEMCACLATTGVARAAHGFFQRFKSVFHPRLTDLLNAFVVVVPLLIRYRFWGTTG